MHKKSPEYKQTLESKKKIGIKFPLPKLELLGVKIFNTTLGGVNEKYLFHGDYFFRLNNHLHSYCSYHNLPGDEEGNCKTKK